MWKRKGKTSTFAFLLNRIVISIIKIEGGKRYQKNLLVEYAINTKNLYIKMNLAFVHNVLEIKEEGKKGDKMLKLSENNVKKWKYFYKSIVVLTLVLKLRKMFIWRTKNLMIIPLMNKKDRRKNYMKVQIRSMMKKKGNNIAINADREVICHKNVRINSR